MSDLDSTSRAADLPGTGRVASGRSAGECASAGVEAAAEPVSDCLAESSGAGALQAANPEAAAKGDGNEPECW